VAAPPTASPAPLPLPRASSLSPLVRRALTRHHPTPSPSSPSRNDHAPRSPPSLNGGHRRACRPPPLRPPACPSALYKRRAPSPNPPAPLPLLSSPARATRSLAGAGAPPTALAVDLLHRRLYLPSKASGEFLESSSSFWCSFRVKW
jgi:hypothetical protein